jgi:hypothetical protein
LGEAGLDIIISRLKAFKRTTVTSWRIDSKYSALLLLQTGARLSLNGKKQLYTKFDYLSIIHLYRRSLEQIVIRYHIMNIMPPLPSI